MLKVGKDLFFGKPSFLDLASDGAAQHAEQFALQLDWDRLPGAREENTGDAAAPCYQDRIFRPKQTSRLVSKLADRADSHVATSVTIIRQADGEGAVWRVLDQLGVRLVSESVPDHVADLLLGEGLCRSCGCSADLEVGMP